MNRSLSIICLIILGLLPVVNSCTNTPGETEIKQKPGKDEMADLNRYLIQKDRERILNFIERKNLTMKESPTGLWYQILNEGQGNNFVERDRLIMSYECSLLDGTICYSSETLGPKEFVVARGGMEAGLSEGLKLLKPGAEAIFILPPFLAYGLVGDGKMIPSRAVIVYKVNILQAK